jgi:DNA-binding transcriptional LysR family regulator
MPAHPPAPTPPTSPAPGSAPLNPHRVNFKLLHVFVAIADHGSFRTAADVLHRSQSAVSMQIRQLEEQLSVPLFHRTTRRVRLTREGEQLLAFARRALLEWEMGLRQIREAADIQRGTLALACVPTVAAVRLPAALAAFQALHPGISVHLREQPGEELFEAVRNQQVDFAIGPDSPEYTDFAFSPIRRDPTWALAREGQGLDADGPISLAALARLPVLLNTRTAALRAALEREATLAGLALDVRYEVVHTHTLIAFAAAGLGVAVLPEIAMPDPLPPTMRAARIDHPPLVRELGVITSRGQALSPAAAALRAEIERALREPSGA